VDRDGFADIITGAGAGGGPHVRVFSGQDGAVLHEFFAYDPQFQGGVNVTSGDVDRDGFVDIITGAGPGGGPHVRGFRGIDGAELSGFFAFDETSRGGVSVAATRRDPELRDDVILTPGESGKSVAATLRIVSGETHFANELGIYPVADEEGRIGTLRPGDPGYARAAIEAAVFSQRLPSGELVASEFALELVGNHHYGLFLIQNSSSAAWLENNPTNDRHGSPLAFFSFNAASPDGFDHLQFQRENVFEIPEDMATEGGDDPNRSFIARWEDLTAGGDRDFNDLVVRISFEKPDEDPNRPPTLEEIPDAVVNERQRFSFIVIGNDPDGNELTYSLEPGAPEGAVIDPITGEFSWIPTTQHVLRSHEIVVKVTDRGSPVESATESFYVFVKAGLIEDTDFVVEPKF
jgi:hypothetical protein